MEDIRNYFTVVEACLCINMNMKTPVHYDIVVCLNFLLPTDRWALDRMWHGTTGAYVFELRI